MLILNDRMVHVDAFLNLEYPNRIKTVSENLAQWGKFVCSFSILVEKII